MTTAYSLWGIWMKSVWIEFQWIFKECLHPPHRVGAELNIRTIRMFKSATVNVQSSQICAFLTNIHQQHQSVKSFKQSGPVHDSQTTLEVEAQEMNPSWAGRDSLHHSFSKVEKTEKRLTIQMTPPGTWTPPMTMSSLRSRDVPTAVG